MKKLFSFILLIFAGLVSVWAQNVEPDHWMKGMAAIYRGDFATAIQMLDQADPPGGDRLRLYLARGEAKLRSGNYSSAVEDFSRAEQIQAGVASLALARCWALTGDVEKAVRWLEIHLRSSYRVPVRKILLDTAFASLEDTPEWRALWKTDWYTDREEEMADVEFLLMNGDFSEAHSRVRGMIDRYSPLPELLVLEGRTLLLAGKPAEALNVLEEIRETKASDTTVLLLQARAAEAIGDYDKAIQAANRVLGKFPERFDLLLYRARLFAAKKDFKHARNDLFTYQTFFPDDDMAIFLLGRYSADDGQYTEAMRWYSKAIDQDPGKPEYFIARADVYMKTRTYRYAIQDYGMALDLDPNNAAVYLSMGRAQLKRGKTRDACFSFQRAQHLGSQEATILIRDHCRQK